MKEPLPPQHRDDREVDSISLLLWFFLGAILVFSVVVTRPMIKRQRIKANHTSAVSSLRGISIGLSEFESVYGSFPDSATALEIKRKTGTPLTLSDKTSNDVFVHLFAAGIVNSEKIFATHSGFTKKPDDDWSSDATALAHGETGFAFVAGLSPKGNPSCPIVFGPVIPGTRKLDVDSFDGKAVILKLDMSVASAPIDASGRIVVNGRDLLDPKNPIWGGKAPDVRWPK
jgi:hypothetical protein